MAEIELKVITPTKVVKTEMVTSVTAPGQEGELTVLARHQNTFVLLKEGIITIRKPSVEDEFLAIGGGYLETDGKQVSILVSAAYGQEEINREQVEKAIEQAKKVINETKDKQEQAAAIASLRKSELSLKLLQKRRRRGSGSPSEHSE